MNNKSIHILNPQKIEYFLLSLILILGFLVRLYKINNPIADWHSWRQADTASVTRTYIQNGINLLIPKFDDISSIQSRIFNPNGYRMVEFPIYNAIAAVSTNTFPKLSLEVWSRLITIFFALTTSFFLYLIGKRFLGSTGGLLSALFYLFIPFNIYFTRVILPDPMGVTFGVISIWAFVKFFDDSGNAYLYLSAVFAALMLLIKPYLGFYLFPIAYLFNLKYGFRNIFKNKKLLFNSLLYFAIAFLPFILWRIWESRFPAGIPLFWWAFNGNGIRFHPAYWNWIFGERLGHLILGSLGLIPFVFGILNTKVKNLFIHWFLAGFIFYVVLVADANVMHDYYQILVIPVIALTLASGSIYLWNQQVFNKILARSILIFSILIMLITGWFQVKGDYIVNHPEIIEAGNEVDKITPKNSIVVAPYNGDTAFLYQTKRKGWPAIDNSIDNIIKEGASYYVSVDLGSADTKMIESRFKTIEKTDKYIIINLTEPVSKSK
ncbi:MAG TPA: glycosyltransferase family 39 protein [Patescibacteria group bacterium]|nr:glycosyltransferase family 39 protein [Patescibacteria group bacterium]